MHFHPILLVRAENLEAAKQQAEDFCGSETGEHAYFDYAGIVPDTETPFNKPAAEVRELLPPDTHLEEALQLLTVAQATLNEQACGPAGYAFQRAGKLLGQHFCIDAPLFNIQFYDYSRPDGADWFAVEADFHY